MMEQLQRLCMRMPIYVALPTSPASELGTLGSSVRVESDIDAGGTFRFRIRVSSEAVSRQGSWILA